MWETKYHRVYKSAEERTYRFNVFVSNWHLVNRLNKQGKAVYELNRFADQTQPEFVRSRLRTLPLPKPTLNSRFLKLDTTISYPDHKNWTAEGAVTPVKDQEYCNGCWSFSTTGNMEGVHYVKYKKLPSISEQQLLDCEEECMVIPGTQTEVCDQGCDGGLMPNAYVYAIREGMASESDYPFKGIEGPCKYNKTMKKYTFSDWKYIESNEDAMVAALNTYGPISSTVDATYWSFYKGGIFDGTCSSNNMNHAILIVGYGEEKGTKYWIIKNSWGDYWGENGYVRLPRGKNMCGINNFICTILP